MLLTNRVDLIRKQLRLLRRAVKALEQLERDLTAEEKRRAARQQQKTTTRPNLARTDQAQTK